MKTVIVIVIVMVAFLGLGFLLFKQSNKPESPKDLPGQAIELQGAQHIPEGSTDHPPYNSNPPTSGWHWPQPASWGAYNESQPDERLIHNLEHGGIWISYKSSLDSTTVELLKDFARRYRKVIVAPRDANDSLIAVVAWGRLMKLDGFDENQILKFIEAYYDEGPEKAP
ncbi:MAG: DUF3105 domain-containing protein [Candidatus Doudnabacteria bacterium]|nr:DUF3105 domain-containing protein [Candidatus Doudnabacteria bacterium]